MKTAKWEGMQVNVVREIDGGKWYVVELAGAQFTVSASELVFA